MRIEFQLTSQDFEETGHHHNRYLPWFICWAVGSLALASLISDVIWPVPSVPPDVPYPPVPWNGYLMLVPWGCSLALIIALLLQMVRSINLRPWNRKRIRRRALWRGWAWLAFGSLFVGCAVLAPVAIRETTAATIAAGFRLGPDVSPAQDVIVPLVPIALAMALLAWLTPRLYRRVWAAQRHMHRPWVAEVSEDHLRMSEPLSTLEYRWGCFAGFLETANVFVLYLSPHLFHMIPKRSFPDDVQVDAFRELLKRVVQEPLQAFAVLPPSLPSPPPVRVDVPELE